MLNDTTVSKFAPNKWIGVSDLSSSQYFVNKNIRFKTPMLRSHLCDSNDTYMIVKETITVEGTNANNQADKKVTFEDNAQFSSCLLKIKSITHL